MSPPEHGKIGTKAGTGVNTGPPYGEEDHNYNGIPVKESKKREDEN